MKKKELEIFIEKIPPHPEPKAYLEQYTTPAGIVADMVYWAYQMGDVQGKNVCDLGCGTGRFAVASAVLGAERVYAIDIDEKAVDVLKKIADKYELNIKTEVMSVEKFYEKCHTVFQNPPFGSQVRGADLPFLKKAMEVGEVVYTIHNTITEDFINKKVLEYGGVITLKKVYRFRIPQTYRFHKKKAVEINTTMFKIEVR